MDFDTPPGDAPDQGNNGSPLDLGDFVQNALLSSESKDDALRAFIQHGLTNKEEAARLFNFCLSPEFSWFDNEDNSNNSSSNNAAARPMEPCDSTHMSASSSSSSQNPPTQPQTPTLTHNSSIGLEYRIPDDDDVGLETFLLWLLGSQPQRIPQNKVKKLYDMSRLPGHGTDGGFQALIDAANSTTKKTKPAAPTATPMMAEIQSPNADVAHVEQQSAHAQEGFLPHSYQQDQLPHLYQHSHGNLFMHQAQIDHSHPLGPPSPCSAFMPHPSMPATTQQENAIVQQFVSPAALSQMDGNFNLVSPSAMSQAMARADSVTRDNATSSAVQASPLESPLTTASQGPNQHSNGPQSIAQASPEPSEAAASPMGDLSNKIKLTCPISKDCNKTVASDNNTNAYKYLIEHIRRIHPDNYIQGLPSNKESVEKMITMEVALCTIPVNGAPCDFRVAGQKGQRAPWRQALDHVREAHPEKDTQGLTANKASFLALMNGGIVVRCPLPNKEDGSPCLKICVGDQAYRSIIEHVRRAHENLYSKQRSTKEGWAKILELNGISASDMQRSISNGSSSSVHSVNAQAPQNQSVPRQTPNAPSGSQPVQAPAIASGSSQVPASEIHGPSFASAERHLIASPEGPREFVHPYMLQHEVGPVAFYPQHGHAGAMAFNAQSDVVPVPFTMGQGSQVIGHDGHGRQLSIDGALKPYFGDNIQSNQLDPTLGPSLFPSMSENIAGPQSQPTHVHPAHHNGHQQRRISHGQSVHKQSDSRQGVDASIRKRGRDETGGVNARSLERPPKKVNAQSQSATLGSTARLSPNGHPGFGGPIPPLTAEWFGLGLEKLASDPFSVLTGPTIGELTVGILESSRHHFREEMRRRWPTADKLAVAPPEEILALMVPMGLQPERARRLRDTLQTLARSYVKMPPTKHRRFGCENYPTGAVHNVVDGEVFEAEDMDLANEVHARNASWEIGHITKRPVAIDAWRIFCRDELLGRAQDWKGTGAVPEFEPEWKRVSPNDTALRTFVGWLWMKEGLYWDPLTAVKQPLPECTRLAVNKGCIYFNSKGRLYFRTSAGVLEPIDGSGTSPSMPAAPDMNGGASVVSMATVSPSMRGAPDGLAHSLPAPSGFTHGSPSALASPALPFADAGDNGFLYGAIVPTDGPSSGDGVAAFDNGSLNMFNGEGANLGGEWGQMFHY